MDLHSLGCVVYFIGCALQAPHQTITSVSEREVKKKFPRHGFGGLCHQGIHQTLTSVFFFWRGSLLLVGNKNHLKHSNFVF